MFRSRQAISKSSSCGLLLFLLTNSNNRHLRCISQLGKRRCNNSQQLQRQQQFGSHSSAVLLTSEYSKKQNQLAFNTLSGYNAQIGDSQKMLGLVEQKRLFTADASSSSGQQQEQQNEKGFSSSEEEQKKLTPRNLAREWLQLDDTTRLHLTLEQGKRMKFFELTKSFVNRPNYIVDLPNLPLEFGYPFVSAMDTLLKTLLNEEITYNSSSPVVLESQRVNADFFDFKLELIQLGNAYMFKVNSIKTVKEQHREREMRFPVRALPWLRKTMAQMLTEHEVEGSQQLGPEPPELPESILKEFSSSEEQQQKSVQKLPRNLAKKWLQLDDTNRLQLKLRQGEIRKFFSLAKFENEYRIIVPNMAFEIGYPFVSAMDTLLKTLLAKHEEINYYYNSSSEQLDRPSVVVLERQRVDAYYFDFQLELIWLGNGNAYMFKLNSIKTVHEHHREREMRLPVRALPLLRETMAQMLTEHDNEGSQQLGSEPPDLPESILKARPPAAAVQKHQQSPRRSATFTGR